MDGSIQGVDGEHVKVYVTDTAGVEHDLTLSIEPGEVLYHDQDAYPNRGVNQSTDDVIYLRQAQEYAKYHVLHERGCPTLDPEETPAWLALVLGAVSSLDAAAFERHFGEYVRQYQSAIRPDVEPVIEVPEASGLGGVAFRADVYLDLDFQAYVDDPEGRSPLSAVEGVTDPAEVYDALGAEVGGDPIEAVSDLEVFYQTDRGGTVEEQTVGERTGGPDRPADATLEMTPPQTTIETDLSPTVLQGLVCHHLECQVRDAFLRLGLEPPEAFRVLGQGRFEQTKAYEFGSVHPRYHVTDIEIEGYRQPGTDLDLGGQAPLAGGAGPDSIAEILKRALFGRS